LRWRHVESDPEFRYVYEKKRYLVNGLHTAIAILGHARLRAMGRPVSDQAFPLVADSVVTGWRERRMLDVLVRAQALYLILCHRSFIRGEAPLALPSYSAHVQYAERALARFRSFPDELTRVLAEKPGKVAAKFRALFEPLANFVEDSENADRWRESYAARGRPPVAEVIEVVAELSEVAMKLEARKRER
jgi:hypothetical protein